MNYEKVKEILLSKGIFVLDKRKSVEEIKYLVNCGYKVLYAKFDSYYRLYYGNCVCYTPLIINNEILKDIDDKELYKEFKQISYHPKTIIEYAQRNYL